MANRVYLCGTNEQRIYPSFWDEHYSPDNQTIATASYKLPMLWMLLFSEGDIQEETFQSQGEAISAYAPIADKSNAIRSLETNSVVIKDLLGVSHFDNYISVFKQEITQSPFSYITIELEELDCMEESGVFRRRLESIYSSLSSPLSIRKPGFFKKLFGAETPSLLQMILQISEYNMSSGLPATDCLVKNSDFISALVRCRLSALSTRGK